MGTYHRLVAGLASPPAPTRNDTGVM